MVMPQFNQMYQNCLLIAQTKSKKVHDARQQVDSTPGIIPPPSPLTLLTLKANNIDCVCHHSCRLYSCHLYMSCCCHRVVVIVVVVIIVVVLNSFVGEAMIHALPSTAAAADSCRLHPGERVRLLARGRGGQTEKSWAGTFANVKNVCLLFSCMDCGNERALKSKISDNEWPWNGHGAIV
jgi:hypothetical protein